LTSYQIAERLNLTKRTANFHAEEATKKLGATNRTDAAVKAMMLGLAG
jgi:DNA-binding NarL/FixJ family response regulator